MTIRSTTTSDDRPNPATESGAKILSLRKNEPDTRPVRTLEIESKGTDEELIFRLQVQLDLQRERELLYKVLVVVQAIVCLVLVRECLIRYLA